MLVCVTAQHTSQCVYLVVSPYFHQINHQHPVDTCHHARSMPPCQIHARYMPPCWIQRIYFADVMPPCTRNTTLACGTLPFTLHTSAPSLAHIAKAVQCQTTVPTAQFLWSAPAASNTDVGCAQCLHTLRLLPTRALPLILLHAKLLPAHAAITCMHVAIACTVVACTCSNGLHMQRSPACM